MVKKAVKKVVKNTTKEDNKTSSLPVSDSSFRELDLSIADGFDVDKILAESEKLTKIKVGTTFFPSEHHAEGEMITGVFAGVIPMVNDKGEKYQAVVLAGKNKEKIVCSSIKAVEGLKGVKKGVRVDLTYQGDIRTSKGNVMRKVGVTYYE